MPFFALTMRHGPRWDDARGIREQDAWDQHADFMDGLRDSGFIYLGGPLGDGEQILHIVEATDESEIETRMAADPWAAMGLLQVGAVDRWSIWIDGRPHARSR